MKRLNYFEVHKNKKPKKLKEKKPSKFMIQCAIIAMQSFTQHAIIVSQNFNSIIEKKLAVTENVKNFTDVMINLFKREKAGRYLHR